MFAGIFGTVVEIIVLVVLVWVAIFGTGGALIARDRGGSSAMGFLLGSIAGPIGWIILWLGSGRFGKRRSREQSPTTRPEPPRGEHGPVVDEPTSSSHDV